MREEKLWDRDEHVMPILSRQRCKDAKKSEKHSMEQRLVV